MDDFNEEEEIEKQAVNIVEVESLDNDIKNLGKKAGEILTVCQIDGKLKELNKLLTMEHTPEIEEAALSLILMICDSLHPNMTKKKERTEVEDQTVRILISLIPINKKFAMHALYLIRKLLFVVPTLLVEETTKMFVENTLPWFSSEELDEDILNEISICVGNIIISEPRSTEFMLPFLPNIISNLANDVSKDVNLVYAIYCFVKHLTPPNIDYTTLYSVLRNYLDIPLFSGECLFNFMTTSYALKAINESVSYDEAKVHLLETDIPSFFNNILEYNEIRSVFEIFSICLKIPELIKTLDFEYIYTLFSKSGTELASISSEVLALYIEQADDLDFKRILLRSFELFKSGRARYIINTLKIMNSVILKAGYDAVLDVKISDISAPIIRTLMSYNDEAILYLLNIIYYMFDAYKIIGIIEKMKDIYDNKGITSQIEELVDSENPEISEKASSLLKFIDDNITPPE